MFLLGSQRTTGKSASQEHMASGSLGLLAGRDGPDVRLSGHSPQGRLSVLSAEYINFLKGKWIQDFEASLYISKKLNGGTSRLLPSYGCKKRIF